MAFDSGMFSGGIESLLGGLFGNSGQPYGDAMNQLQQYLSKAEGIQNPYLQAGNKAIGNYQDWLGQMKDPTEFMNKTMNQYQASPWSKYLQNQSLRSAQAAGSASGLTGSTPMMQQIQQNASNISSGDMNSWLQNVLGVNNQYGAGQQYLMGQGANSANALTNLYGDYGKQMAQGAYNQGAGENNDFWNMIGGGADAALSFL